MCGFHLIWLWAAVPAVPCCTSLVHVAIDELTRVWDESPKYLCVGQSLSRLVGGCARVHIFISLAVAVRSKASQMGGTRDIIDIIMISYKM